MIPRAAAATLERLAKGFPVLAITGPRQSGKSTLAKACFPDKPYVTLENPEEREFVERDPKRFLARFPDGAIVDEAQRCPPLFSWLQGWVDERRQMGDFILTGSAQFDLLANITQSLAGRVGHVQLLPLSWEEMRQGGIAKQDLNEVLLSGGYPAVHDRQLAPDDWFPNYVMTYLERDARQLLGIRDLSLFQRFIRLCAARSGQQLNLASLGADCGISAVTARQWLSVLEASYLVTRISPYYENFGKRLVKTPKLYFLDTGLMAWLLGLRDPQTLDTHINRGALFETWVVAELIKQRFNAGRPHDLYYWRDNTGHEIDLLRTTPDGLNAIEIKSGSTFASDWLAGLQKWQRISRHTAEVPCLVYGGNESYTRESTRVLSWRNVADV